MSQFCVCDPRADASGENVFRPTTRAVKRSVTVKRFRRKKRHSFSVVFSNEPVPQVLQGMPVERFAQISDCLGGPTSRESYLMPKVGPILKLSDFKATAQVPGTRFPYKTPNVLGVFRD